MNRILIAEDEARIASFVVKGLRANGFVATVVVDGQMAIDAARDADFDLLVLDVGLPVVDGFEVLRALRSRGETLPVIVLTARGTADDAVEGLQLGADDYMRKPFAFEELLARIRLRLRRPAPAESTVLTAGDLTLDVLRRDVVLAGRRIDLTAREFAVLEVLMRHRGQVLSREQLLSRVWGFDYDPGSNIVDVYVGYLRRKLGDGYLETLRGVGYRFAPG